MRSITLDMRRSRLVVRRSYLAISLATLLALSAVLGAVANAASVVVSMRILAPVFEFTVTGVADGGAYNEPVTPRATSRDATAVYVARLDGEPYQLGVPISGEGAYTLLINASNEVGDLASKSLVFSIDYTPPPILIEGIEDGAHYSHPVAPVFSSEGDATVVVFCNGEPFTEGAAIEEEGEYTIEVIATDRAGNVATRRISFVVDLTPPDLVILGVSEGRTYGRMVVPFAHSSDPTAGLLSTLNGAPFMLGTAVIGEGEHVLVVTATDPAGNARTKSVTFWIDYSIDEVTIELTASPERDLRAIALSWKATAGVEPAGYRIVKTLSLNDVFGALAYAETVDSAYLDERVLAGKAHYYRVLAFDAQGREIGESNMATAVIDPAFVRLWGNDRILTAVDISRNTFEHADTVILATSGDFADALSASGLAGSYRSPILLTRSNALSSATQAEIERLGAGRVIVVGGQQAIGEAVEKALFKQGLAVSRLAGPTRYETAIVIADEIERNERAEGRARSGQVFLARGDLFADALSVSSFAYSQRAPVLFTRPSSLPGAVRSYARRTGFTSVLVAGGTAAVSDAVATDFAAAAGAALVRAGGADRYATSMIASQLGVDREWAQWRSVGIATGANFPDALSGCVNAGQTGGALLLTRPDRLEPGIVALLKNNPGAVFDVTIYGGTMAVSDQVERSLRGLLIE